jgi:hypothetical protein
MPRLRQFQCRDELARSTAKSLPAANGSRERRTIESKFFLQQLWDGQIAGSGV